MVNFFNDVFHANLVRADIKACHFLGPPSNAPAIIKFVYFANKHFIWWSKKVLRQITNKANQKPIYLSERLPEKCSQILNEAKDLRFFTVTNKAEVQVKCPGANGKSIFRPVINFNKLYNLKDVAKKFLHQSKTKNLQREGQQTQMGLHQIQKIHRLI